MTALSGQPAAGGAADLLAAGSLAGEWTLDPRRSGVRLRSRAMWGLVPVTGEFREVSGYGTVAADGTARAMIVVSAASIDTRNPRRDAHLRSADFFDSENHQDITFAADEVRPAGKGLAVTGVLTVRGRTTRLSFDAAVVIGSDGEIQVDAEVPVDRRDVSVTWNMLAAVSTRTVLTARAVFTRK